MATKYVRVKPHNKRKGFLVKRYMTEGQKFEVEKGWYRVDDDAFAARLEAITQDGTEDTPPVFDVCTKEEAQRIDAAESKKVERASVDEADTRGVNRATSRTVKTRDVRPKPKDDIDRAFDDEDEGAPMIDGADGDPPIDADDESPKGSAIGKIKGASEADSKPKTRTRSR